MTRTAALLLTLVLLPTAVAHVGLLADPRCDPAVNPHHYGLAVRVDGSAPFVHPGGFVAAQDGCPTWDGEPESGASGGFLPAGHHSSTVCVLDEVYGANVRLAVGADGDGDGAVTATAPDHVATGVGCATAAGPAGADGGWWVFLQSEHVTGHLETS